MSFTKTLSAVAALSSIFGVGVAGYKLAESSANTAPSKLDEKIMQLERQLEEVTSQKPVVEVAPPEPLIAPPPVILPTEPVMETTNE
jgi:hypothetical protein